MARSCLPARIGTGTLPTRAWCSCSSNAPVAVAPNAQKGIAGRQEQRGRMGCGLGSTGGAQRTPGDTGHRERGTPWRSAGHRGLLKLTGWSRDDLALAGAHLSVTATSRSSQWEPLEPGPAVWPPGYRPPLRWCTKDTPDDKAPQPVAAVMAGKNTEVALLLSEQDGSGGRTTAQSNEGGCHAPGMQGGVGSPEGRGAAASAAQTAHGSQGRTWRYPAGGNGCACGPSMVGCARLREMSRGGVLGGQARTGCPPNGHSVDEPPGGNEGDHCQPVDETAGGPMVRRPTHQRPTWARGGDCVGTGPDVRRDTPEAGLRVSHRGTPASGWWNARDDGPSG